MAYENKDMSGALFHNDKQNDRQPDWRGDITIKGVKYRLVAWNRTSANGKQFLSLSAEEFQNTDQQQAAPQPRVQQPKEVKVSVESQDLPF